MVHIRRNSAVLRLLVVAVVAMVAVGSVGPAGFVAAQDEGPPDPPHRYSGTVADADGGNGVAGATVTATYEGETLATTETNSDGEYALEVSNEDSSLSEGDEVTLSVGDSSEDVAWEPAGVSTVDFEVDGDEVVDGDDGDDGTGGGGAPGGGGGGGGMPPSDDGGDDWPEPTRQAVQAVSDAEPDAPGITMRFSGTTLEEIVFSSEESGGAVAQVSVDEFDDLPGNAPALPEQARAVSVSRITVPDAYRDSPATLRMRVGQERLDALDADPEELTVYRLPDGADEWQPLETAVSETDDGVVLEFETPGFSAFAVAQQQQDEEPTPTPTPTDTDDEDETPTPTDTEVTDTPGDGDGDDEGPSVVLLGLLVVVVLALAGGAVYYFTQQQDGG